MKTRIFSLLAVLLFCVTPSVSALRIQSQAIGSLRVSQLSVFNASPEEVQGKIWGQAPRGEVTHILYRIIDANGAITWEQLVPYAQKFEGTEDLDVSFSFDLSDILADDQSRLIALFQRVTMNGAFAQTVAQGEMGIVFPNSLKKERLVSRIEKMLSFVDAQNVVVQTEFKNLQAEGKFFARAAIFNESGLLLRTTDSVTKTILTGGTAEFSSLFDLPTVSGRYKTTVQVFEGKTPVTGIKEQSIVVAGEFAIITALEVFPEEYFYAGDTATLNISGTSSSWGAPLTLDLTIKDISDMEIFMKEFPLQTNEVGQFSEKIEVPIYKETAQLQTQIELRRGTKIIGTYAYETQRLRKIHPAEGQSAVSFAIERMSQDFLFGGTRDKIKIILSFLVLISLLVGFVFFVRHIRATHLLLLLCSCFIINQAFADSLFSSTYPNNGWIINPSSEEGFQKLQFQGIVDFVTVDTFPFNTPISVDIKFGDTYSLPLTFTTLDVKRYDFILDVPSSVVDGIYPLTLEMKWKDMEPFFEGVLEIELLDGTDALSIITDKTDPGIEFEYFSGNGDPLEEGSFSKDPIKTRVVCDDPTGCMLGDTPFEVRGNFCEEAAICPQNAVDQFVICDHVANCTDPEQIEINQYDPVPPSLESFSITQNTEDGLDVIAEESSQIKAFASYVFSFLGLDDPEEAEGIEVDATACGESDESSPFVSDGTVCLEKYVACAISPTERGFRTYPAEECVFGCPDGYEATANGTCEAVGCSNVSFPFCFDWLLNGRCESFPFCFNWILGEDE